jgi:hypothetical protein
MLDLSVTGFDPLQTSMTRAHRGAITAEGGIANILTRYLAIEGAIG